MEKFRSGRRCSDFLFMEQPAVELLLEQQLSSLGASASGARKAIQGPLNCQRSFRRWGGHRNSTGCRCCPCRRRLSQGKLAAAWVATAAYSTATCQTRRVTSGVDRCVGIGISVGD